MSKILVISQNENDIWFVNGLSIGKRQPRVVIGTKIKELLKKSNLTEEGFITTFESNYKDNIRRVLEDKEIPKEKLFDKILKFFNVNGIEYTKDHFFDTELENVIVNNERMVMAEYSTNEITKQVMEMVRNNIKEAYAAGKPIIVQLPKESSEE